MAGLTKRFCREACPYKDEPDFKGLCGACSGKAYPCDPDDKNCGKWQDADCLRENDPCGDGHNCPRYIDIEFTLNAFAIQGKTCCNAKTLAITQQCEGAFQNNETPIDAPPQGWSATENGEQDFVIYEKTEHQIRLTRSDCGCHWGGYWSSQCDCNTCCCTNDGGTEPDGDCTTADIYPDCDDCYQQSCLPSFGTCVADDGTGCRGCDPSLPCYPTDDGYASSLDSYGTGNIGGSDGQAICSLSSCASTGSCTDPCGNITNDCDSWAATSGVLPHACWDCGEFKQHHIQAYFTMKGAADDPAENCHTAWAFSIRGMTDLTASELGVRTNPSLDCYSHGEHNVCNHLPSSGGTAERCMGYTGFWEGTSLSSGTDCTDCLQEGNASPTEGLVMNSCGCPVAAEINSTVRVTNAIAAFHPSAVCGENNSPDIEGAQMHTCVVKDSEGSQPSETWCNNLGIAGSSVCIEKEFATSLGVCYGSPQLWYDKCEYCGGASGCCDTHWDGCSAGCACDPYCDCPYPTSGFGTTGVDQYPCQYCGSSDPSSLNHTSCIPCDSGNSRVCAPCNIKITPNNSPVPSWHKST